MYSHNIALNNEMLNKCEFISMPEYKIQYMDMIDEQGEYCTLTYKIIRISFKVMHTWMEAGFMKSMCVAFFRLVLGMCKPWCVSGITWIYKRHNRFVWGKVQHGLTEFDE